MQQLLSLMIDWSLEFMHEFDNPVTDKFVIVFACTDSSNHVDFNTSVTLSGNAVYIKETMPHKLVMELITLTDTQPISVKVTEKMPIWET